MCFIDFCFLIIRIFVVCWSVLCFTDLRLFLFFDYFSFCVLFNLVYWLFCCLLFILVFFCLQGPRRVTWIIASAFALPPFGRRQGGSIYLCVLLMFWFLNDFRFCLLIFVVSFVFCFLVVCFVYSYLLFIIFAFCRV